LLKAKVWKEELDDNGKENCSLCLGMAGATYIYIYIYIYIYKFPEEKEIEKAIFIKNSF